MSIHDYLEKIKPFYFLILAIFLAIIFFALGRLSVLEENKTPIRILEMNSEASTSQTANVVSAFIADDSNSSSVSGVVVPAVSAGSEEVIGSKSGKKYYYPWCGTVKRINPANQVHFASITEARSAGYLPGGNCKGLK